MLNEIERPVARLRLRLGDAEAVARIEWKSGERHVTLCYDAVTNDIATLRARYSEAVEAVPKVDDDDESLDRLTAALLARDIAVERMPDWDQEIVLALDDAGVDGVTQSRVIPGGKISSEASSRDIAFRMKRAISGLMLGSIAKMHEALQGDDAQSFIRAIPPNLVEGEIPVLVELVAAAASRAEWAAERQKMYLVASDAAFRAGCAEIARRLAEHGIAIAGGSDDINFTLGLAVGNCYAVQRNFGSAKLTYEAALERWPRVGASNKAWAFQNLGNVHFSMGNPTEGTRAFDQAAQLRAAARQALEPAKTLARCAARLEQFNPFSALAQYDAALAALSARAPTHADPTAAQLRGTVEFARGRLLVDEAGQPQRALEAFRAAADLLKPLLEEADAFASVLMWQAHCHRSLGQDDVAAKILGEREAFASDVGDLMSARIESVLKGEAQTAALPGDEAAATYAEATRVIGSDLPRALELLERVVHLGRTSREPDAGLEALLLSVGAHALWECGKRDDAVVWERRAVAAYPGSTARRSTLAAFLFASQRYQECFIEADKLARDFPGLPHGHFYAGLSAHRTGDYAEAVTRLEAARALGAATVDAVLEDANVQLARQPGAVTLAATAARRMVAEAPPVTHRQFLEALGLAVRRIERNSDVFWRSRKERSYKEHPEAIGKALLVQDLSRDPACRIYNEVQLPGGRMDLTVNVYGTEYLLELKMCGGGYSKTYAEDGFEQLRGYMKLREATRGYLVVFDGRVTQSKAASMPREVDVGDGCVVFCVGCNLLGVEAK